MIFTISIVISLVTTNGEIIGQVNVTGGGLGIFCSQFDAPAEGNYFDLGCYDFMNAYLILEENIIPLLVSWKKRVYGRYNMILIDMEVAFGIGLHPSEINHITYEC